jgi:hypothetical protein
VHSRSFIQDCSSNGRDVIFNNRHADREKLQSKVMYKENTDKPIGKKEEKIETSDRRKISSDQRDRVHCGMSLAWISQRTSI